MENGFELSIQPGGYYRILFQAMASPCEILLDTQAAHQAGELAAYCVAETRRIEQKFSRYRQDNIIYQINQAAGQAITVDDETCALLDFASQLFVLSAGRFDISSGILRRAWKFDGSANIPSQAQIDALLPFIGWQKAAWQKPVLTLPPGMEIDLGGIGKEYAVDKVFEWLAAHTNFALLVNFGGDLRLRGPRHDGSQWHIGFEKIHAQQQEKLLSLQQGAIATSGDSQRYLLKDGIRYSHILNPLTGWPVQDAPRAVTVLAPTCIEAGIFTSLALMMGKDAEQFLESQQVSYWSVR